MSSKSDGRTNLAWLNEWNSVSSRLDWRANFTNLHDRNSVNFSSKRPKSFSLYAFVRTVASERGNVESALTVIPLMLLFLTVLQLGLGVYGRITIDQMVQGGVARRAMGINNSQSLTTEGFLSHANPAVGITAIPLPGGGALDFGTATNVIPSVTPLLPGGDRIASSGLAVQE